MSINPDAVGAKGTPSRISWTADDCILYALSVGAGAADPVSSELEFTTENTSGVAQKVLPTYPVVHSFLGVGGESALSQIGSFDPTLLVHGEEAIRVFKPVPSSGEVGFTDEIVGIYDKGSGAVVVNKATATLAGESEPLYEITMSIFLIGEGGWGGDRGPSGKKNLALDRDPDHVVRYSTREDQALLYRLTGDKNPLHSDKQFSDMGGFPKPILHGLCTFGFTGRGLLHELCGSDPVKFGAMEGRFSAPVFPGEELTIKAWQVDEGSAVYQTAGADGRVVIDNGAFSFGESV